jgi:hypothetical protein
MAYGSAQPPLQMTFAELVAAMQAKAGLRIKLTSDDPSRDRKRRRTVQGVVKPGLDQRTELAPDDDGRLVFRLAPSEWYVLDPRIVTSAREEPDGRLCVEMNGVTWVIETFADQRRVRPS